MYTAIDCLGFAGGFTLGMTQAGFSLVGKREMKGGFGVPNCEANRHLLGDGWRAESGDPRDWTRVDADVVFGNPPCSGFSVMSVKSFRGADSPINACMQHFIDYVSRVGPQIAVFESVQMARTRPDGLELMRHLRQSAEDQTGKKWDLYHVRHNAYSLGGCAIRRRYFFVISQIPFGIEIPRVHNLPTLNNAISDLENLPLTWSKQPYRSPASWWSTTRRSGQFAVDGHIDVDNPLTRRLRKLLTQGTWNQSESIADVVKRYYETHNEFPEDFIQHQEKILSRNFNMGFTTPVRWTGNNPARVITGGSMLTGIHPNLDRTFTHREVARIMGFPDDWRLAGLAAQPGLIATHGKGITVDCGRWIGEWIKSALDGNPGTHVGVPLGEREWDIDVTNTYKIRPDKVKV
jgi:site-specific DNA-cytosine methylase